MRRSGSAEVRWLTAAEQRTAAMHARPSEAPALAADSGNAGSDSTDGDAPWAAGPSSHFQLPDGGRGLNGAAEAAHTAGVSAAHAFPPHATPHGGATGNSVATGRGGAAADAGLDVLRDAATAEATRVKADVMQSAAQSALGTHMSKHMPGRSAWASEVRCET